MIRIRKTLFLALLAFLGCSDGRPAGPPSDPIFSPEKILDTAYVKQRIDQGLNPNARNNAFTNQDCLLTYAVRHGAAETVRLLLSVGADVEIRSSGRSKTPLFQAAYDNQLQIAEILVEHGADVNAVDMFGNNALREAIIGGENREMVRFLLQARCDPYHKNNDGESMAEIANKYGTPEIQKIISDGI
ncbi:MAG: ankyrin repeat domain-containing protein [Planctomycetota bacterium]|nr:ankyrin repeat domain-containing protein [Planctomycetota bacterium]